MNPLEEIKKSIKEAVTFLANEFRGLRNDIRENGKKVDLTLSAETIAKLNEGDTRKFGSMLRGFETIGNSFKLAVAQLVSSMDKLRSTIADKNNDDVVAAVKSLETATKANKPEKVDVSGFDKVVQGQKDLQAAVYNSGKATTEAVSTLAGMIAQLIEKPFPSFPSEMKLNRDQVAMISRSGGGIGGSGVKPATKVTMANTAMASANTEYSYTFPANTTGWDVKLRSQDTLLYYAWETGKLPGSGDGSAYATVPQNGLQARDNVEWSGKTIYLETSGTSQVAEIVSYQL